ncbi:MAG TPA: hypothetical protein VJQ82_16870 [Terriglobales bacterium]|nr:hypothetical protein [Terriglobales bacterium]
MKQSVKRVAISGAALLVVAFAAVTFSAAQEKANQPTFSISQMKGTWVAALSGVTGCGTTTLETTFTLDANGNGTQISATQHTAGCGDIDLSGQTAQIQLFNADGSGFIALGCGSGCGFGFDIQVVKAGPQAFTMAPQTVPGNYLAGVALRKQ